MSSPIELYLFRQGVFYEAFTSGNKVMTYQNITYRPALMERGSVSVTDDVYKSNLTLTFSRNEQFAFGLLNFSNELPYQVSVFRGEQNGTGFILNWSGRIISAKANGDLIDVECESIYTTIVRPGLRARYSKSCRHELYDHACRINYDTSKIPGQIQSISDAVNLVIPRAGGYPAGHFTAGILDAGALGSRFIIDHQGTNVRINRPIGVTVGASVDLLPGCDHLRSTCQDKFNNLVNFGGFPWIPNVNPFGGGRLQ